jgi:hypothetical protein
MSMLARTVSSQVVASADPFVVKKEEFELEVIMQAGYSFEDFKEAVLLVDALRSQYGYAKPRVIFKEEVKVYHRKKYREMKHFDTYFFVGSKSQELCYSARGRTGYLVQWHFPWRAVEKIILIHTDRPDKVKKREMDKEKFFNRVMKARFDEQTWSNLTPDSFSEYKPFYYIKKVFDQWTMQQIQQAFEQKKDFRFTKDDSWLNKKAKRHYTVEGKMCEDGIYRAWFSSEYAGCANGDYYLLLNPQVAVFYETD